jgi:hypothetical protein
VDFSLGRCRNLSSLAHSYAARNLYAIFAPVLGFCYPALVQGNQVFATLDTYKPGFNAGGGLEFHLGDAGLKAFAEARYHEMFTTHRTNQLYSRDFRSSLVGSIKSPWWRATCTQNL